MSFNKELRSDSKEFIRDWDQWDQVWRIKGIRYRMTNKVVTNVYVEFRELITGKNLPEF